MAAPPRKPPLYPWLAALPSALALAVHATSLRGPFVYDDQITVLDNPSLQPGADFFFVLWAERFRPLTNLSYWLDRTLWGFEPFGFHLTSVLLHGLNTFLVFALAQRWQRDGREGVAGDAAPLAAAGLFAVHPLLTQAVSYVSGRSELLCAAFFLTGVLAARRAVVEGSRRWLGATLLLLGLALASKEVAGLLPLVALAWVRLRFEDAAVRRRALAWLLPVQALVGLAAAARASVYFLVSAPVAPRGLGENLQLQALTFWKYLGLFVAPLGQSLVHPFKDPAGVEPLAVAAGVGLAAAAVAAFAARRRFPAAALGLAWFAAALAPSSLIPLNEPMSEHRTYVASAGLFLALASTAAPLLGRALRPALAVVCVVLAALTVARNRVWADERKLWAEAAERAPEVWAAQYGLGDAHRAAGDCRSAIQAYEKAVALVPGEVRAHLNLGICLATVGRPGAAYRAFVRAGELDPKNPAVPTNLATLALLAGNPATARRYLLAAAALEPGNAERRQRADAVPEAPDARPWPPPPD